MNFVELLAGTGIEQDPAARACPAHSSFTPLHIYKKGNTMKTFWRLIALTCLSLGLIQSAPAVERSSADEAVAMVKRAVAYYKKNGREKALAEYNNPAGAFRSGDLYIFVYDAQGNNLAHNNPKMVGKNLIDMRDVDGKYLIRDLINLGNSGSGWVEYKWPNPLTKIVEAKKTYVEKADDLYIMCGVYI